MPPDFIGIGAQKAGTTWLSRNLQLHPGIWMPPIKELHYFDEKLEDSQNPVSRLTQKLTGKRDRDSRWRRQVRRRTERHLKNFSRDAFLWDLKFYAGRPDDRWYASLFGSGAGKVSGEITPAYSMLGREVVARVHAVAPEARIILMMRNPIERAWSQAAMRLDRAGEKATDAAAHAAGREKLRRLFGREGSRSRTDYLRTLENWNAYYPEDRIFVGFLEDIHFFPEALLVSVYNFLSVDDSFRPPGISQKVHTRSTGRVPTEPVSYLADAYREETARLDERFGGYASFWRYSAETLAKTPPPQDAIPYPLWESPLWQDWPGEPKLQSGPLGGPQSGPQHGA